MRKIELKSRNLLRTIFGGVSLTAIAFTFQACYGTPNDLGLDIRLSGTVKSKTTNLPIKGIKVSRPDSPTYQLTDEKGNFSFYTYQNGSDSIPVLFADIDGVDNGNYADTTLIIYPTGKKEVTINVEMNEMR